MINKLKIPFFIAEISANHCGKLSIAKKLIKCANVNGADAVKLQTYTADSMTIKSDRNFFKIRSGLWKGYKLWDLYNEAHTPLAWHTELFHYARKIGITIFSTPFDENAVDVLEKLNCPMYKIASFEMTDLPLIKKVASTKKPIIISTGMASIKEIEETFNFAKLHGSSDITLLYCISNYPAKDKDFNMSNIKILKEKFNCRVGFSDHSKNNNIANIAVALGAEVIEKHIALEKQKNGLDIEFSLKGSEIKEFSKAIKQTYSIVGQNKFLRFKSESSSKKLRRSIFAVQDISKGEVFTKKNIKRIRPGHGLPPKYYDSLISLKSPSKIKRGSPIKPIHLKKLKIK